MSINSAMLAGSAGLRANASALAAISDNISNVSTVGYKRLRNDFSALLNIRNGTGGHNAGGVAASSRAILGEQGALQTSSISTYLSVSGQGFFIVRERGGDATSDDAWYYTRAGQFLPDADGYMRNTAGFYLYGVENFDAISTSPTDLNALVPVRVSGVGGSAQATSKITLSANLNAGQVVSAAAQAGYNSETNNMASGAVEADFQSSLQIYDSFGGLRTMTLSFLKASTPNAWHVEAHIQPAEDVVTGSGLANGQVAVGTIMFQSDGKLDQSLTNFPTRVSIAASGETPAAGAAAWSAGSGDAGSTSLSLAAQSIEMDIIGATKVAGLTQYNSPSGVGLSQVDGVSFGALASVEVNEKGYVSALFTNGLSRNIYQIPLATFPNSGGLIAEEGGVYLAGPDTGSLSMKEPGLNGAGQLRSRALEASTVDLAQEFSDLIITQRAYSASSKIVMTADEMLDELIRLKR